MKKVCTQIQDKLAAFVYGGLNPQEQTTVEKHLSNCPQCADQVRVLRDEQASLRQFVTDLDASMEERLDRVRRDLAAEPPAARSQQSRLWHRLVPGRMARLGAAAAVVLAGIVLLIQVDDGSIDLSNTALARVAQAMDNVPWVHLHTTIVMDGKTRRYEDWLSNPLQISAGKDDEGLIYWSDLAARRRAVYSPDSNSIVISCASPTSAGDIIHPSSPIDAFQKQHSAEDATVTVERGQHNGVEVDIYEASHYGGTKAQRYLRSRHRLVADRKRHLILLTEQYDYAPDGTLMHSNVGPWDYPTDGPTSIYDIGAPRSARVFDFSSSPESAKVLEHYEAKRDTFPDRYVAVVEHSRFDPGDMIDAVHIFYSDAILKRADSLYFHPMDHGEFATDCGNSFETLMDWWQHRENGRVVIRQQSVSLYDKEYAYATSTTPDGSWQPLQKRPSSPGKDRQFWKFYGDASIYGDVLAEFAYPRQLVHSGPTKLAIIEDDYAKDNALIAIELLYNGQVSRGVSGSKTTISLPKQCLFYLDPNRDYFCRREEVRYDVNAAWPTDPDWLDGVPGNQREGNILFDKTAKKADVISHVRRAVMVRDVLEFDRMDNGRWYPKKIVLQARAELYDGLVEERRSMTTIHLNTNPIFRDGTFDPSQLPK